MADTITCEGHSPQWHDGRRNGLKFAIEWLLARARGMNDPHARQVLNSASSVDDSKTALGLSANALQTLGRFCLNNREFAFRQSRNGDKP